jgi:hypothetical protein
MELSLEPKQLKNVINSKGLFQPCAMHKMLAFLSSSGYPSPSSRQEGRLRMKLLVAACILLGLCATAANAMDLAELAPCRPAAAKLCDRSQGMTWTGLLHCGATLAAHSWRVGDECRAVLRKYGQL